MLKGAIPNRTGDLSRAVGAVKSLKELLTIIERICLSNDTSKYYALQGFIAQKRLLNFRQHNGTSLADYHKELEILAKVALEAGADFVTIDQMERKRKIIYPTTQASFLTDHR